MKQPSKRGSRKIRAIVFGLLPCILGIGSAQLIRWMNAVWLTDAGSFWPITLSTISAAILIKLAFSPFIETSSSVAAWLILWTTWFYVPMWVTAAEVPYSAAVVSKDGRVRFASDATRYPEHKVWFLTDRSGTRIVRGVAGKMTVSLLDIEYRYATPYIATRKHGEDLSVPLASAAGAILGEQASGTRASRIALIENRDVQEGVLAKICRTAVGNEIACPLKMTFAPQKDETVPGAAWSTRYTESEAIEERHLPTLVYLLTQSDSSLVQRDKAFALLLELSPSVEPLAQVAQRSHLLDDGQFNELVRRILSSPGCSDAAVAVVSKVNRLSAEQRQALRAKALGEADIATIVDNAAALRIQDPEITELARRMRTTFLADPAVAVRALQVFGDRLPPATQRDAVDGIVGAKAASYSLSALEYLNFSIDLRRDLMKKILADATLGDFSDARLSKEKLQDILTPMEMRALIAMAVKRSETSDKWLEFALASLPIRDMTLAERRLLLNGLLFESPKAALEFVSKNRDYLDPAEVSEITRDYSRTVTGDFCLHLSHRNKNWRTKYFSEAQLEIFRDCAKSR
jgi:hypothetical protein